MAKTFAISIHLNGGHVNEVHHYDDVPADKMVAMENALFDLLKGLNSAPKPAPTPGDPPLSSLILQASVREVSKDGKPWPHPKAYAGLNASWNDIPTSGAQAIQKALVAAMTPFSALQGKPKP